MVIIAGTIAVPPEKPDEVVARAGPFGTLVRAEPACPGGRDITRFEVSASVPM